MEYHISYVALAVLTIIVLIPFGVYTVRRRGDVFEPIYWAAAFFALLFVVRSVYDLTLGSVFISPPLDEVTMNAFVLALLYLIPSLICFLIGYYAQFGRALARSLPSIAQTWNNERVTLLLPVLICIGLTSQILLVQHLGGWSNYLDDKQHTLTESGQGYWMAGVAIIPLAFGVAFTRCLVNKRGRFLTYAVLLPLVFVLGLISGSKAAFLGPFLGMLVAIHYLRRRVTVGAIALFAVLSLLLFPVFNVYRQMGAVDRMAETIDQVPSSLFSDELPFDELGLLFIRSAISRFLGIDSLTYIVRDTPEVMDFQYGLTALGAAVAWVPRQFWDDKPLGFAQLFGETYLGHIFYGTGTAAAPTLLGEAYLNWHIGGMLILALMCGILVRMSYAYLIEQQFGQPAVFFYSSLFPHLFSFWERSIDGIIVALLILIIEAWILIWLMGQSTGKNATEVDRALAHSRNG